MAEDESLLRREETVRMIGGFGSALGEEHGDAAGGVGDPADQLAMVR